jgi:hypothetical protein
LDCSNFWKDYLTILGIEKSSESSSDQKVNRRLVLPSQNSCVTEIRMCNHRWHEYVNWNPVQRVHHTRMKEIWMFIPHWQRCGSLNLPTISNKDSLVSGTRVDSKWPSSNEFDSCLVGGWQPW